MTTNPQADLRNRIVNAIKTSPFEELRTVGYAPNGPLQITIRVEELADAILRALPAAVSVPPPTRADDRAALDNRIAEALKGVRVWRTIDGCDGWEYAGTEALADAVLAVLPPPADRAALEEQLGEQLDAAGETIAQQTAALAQADDWVKFYEAAHARMRDRLEVAQVQEQRHRLALSEALDLGTGAPWDAIHERVQELAAVDTAEDRCAECGHFRGAHEDGQDPVSPGRCTVCADDEAWHNYEPTEEERRLAAEAQPEAPWATDGARIGRALVWSWARVGDTDFGRGYRTAQEDVRAILTRPLLGAGAQQQPEAERPRCPHCQLPHDLEPGSGAVRACASIRASIADREAASGPGRVADEETDAETSERRCPQCGESLANYFTDDFVYRAGDNRPYCSGECVVAANRTVTLREETGRD